MAIAEVQQLDSGSALIASGSSWNLASNVTALNAVILAVLVPGGSNNYLSDTVSSSFGGTWAFRSITIVGSDYLALWVCLGATVVGSQMTVTTTSGNSYRAQATEVSDAAFIISSFSAGNTSTAPALPQNPVAAGNLVFVAAHGSGSSGLTASPVSPWVNYTGGGWLLTTGFGSAYQIAVSSAPITATWAQLSALWGTVGVVLAQGAPLTPSAAAVSSAIAVVTWPGVLLTPVAAAFSSAIASEAIPGPVPLALSSSAASAATCTVTGGRLVQAGEIGR